MNLEELTTRLDMYFNVHAFDEHDGWMFAMDDEYLQAFKRFAREAFVQGSWNGLMLDNAAKVDRVYLVVFPTQNILDTVIAQEVERDAPGCLIFAHHLLSFSERAMQFTPISLEQLEELREHNISFYNCHAPLDCHTETSTANALADAIGLQNQQRFAEYYGGFAGIHGTVGPMSFQKFAERVAEVCELDQLRYDQVRHNGLMVEHVALIPGGGDDPSEMRKAAQVGADTYLTGHWWLFGKSEFAAQRRATAAQAIDQLSLNLIAASHYSTELVVMRDQMVDYFKDMGLEAILMRQQDPWEA